MQREAVAPRTLGGPEGSRVSGSWNRASQVISLNAGEVGRAEEVTPKTWSTEEVPNSQADHAQCRLNHIHNLWVGSIIDLKHLCYNHGLKLVPGDPTEANVKKLRERFVDEPQLEADILSFIAECFRDYLIYDTVVTVWLDEHPLILNIAPQNCKFTDVFNVRKLNVDFKIRDKRALADPREGEFDLGTKLIDRYSRGPVDLDQDNEHFRVLKTGRVGDGFDPVSQARIYRTAEQAISMEVGEHLYAHAARRVFFHHKLGHEIKQGPHAGSPRHFWTKKWGEKVENQFKNRVGNLEFASRFDHDIEVSWIDPQKFREETWKTIAYRMLVWAGPIVSMLDASGVTPMYMPLLLAQAHEARGRIARHCIPILEERHGFEDVGGLRLQWSDQILTDRKTALDAAQKLYTLGPLSAETLIETGGFDPKVEAERKLAEANDPEKDSKYSPHFDAAHGETPSDTGGRPSTTEDPTEVDS